MSAEQGSIEEIRVRLGGVDHALEKTERVLETLGTPTGIPILNFSKSSGPEDLADKLVRFGLTKECLLERALPKLNSKKKELLGQLEILKDSQTLSRIEERIPEIERLAAKGLLPREQLEKLYRERDNLKLKVIPIPEPEIVIEVQKPKEPEKREEIIEEPLTIKTKVEERLGNDVGLKIELKGTKRTRGSGCESKVYLITYADGKTVEVAGYIGNYVLSLSETSIAHPKAKREIISDVNTVQPTQPIAIEGIAFDKYLSLSGKFLRDNCQIKIARVHPWSVVHVEKNSRQEQGYYLAKMEDQRTDQIEDKLAEDKVEDQVEKPDFSEKPKELTGPENRMMDKEEAAIFGSWVKDHDNVQLFGPQQDINTDTAMHTLHLDEETLKLCQELIDQCPFNLTKPGETADEVKERINSLRISAVNKLQAICTGGELGRVIIDQQPKLVQELYSNLFLTYGEILGSHLCSFLTERPYERRVIEKATEEKDKSPYVVKKVIKYWVIPSLDFKRVSVVPESSGIEAINDEPVEFVGEDPVLEIEDVAKSAEVDEGSTEKGSLKRKPLETKEAKLKILERGARDFVNKCLNQVEKYVKNRSNVNFSWDQLVGGNFVTSVFHFDLNELRRIEKTIKSMGILHPDSSNSDDHWIYRPQDLCIIKYLLTHKKTLNRVVLDMLPRLAEEEVARRVQSINS